MKKVFGLMLILALAGLVSCGEAVVEPVVDANTVTIDTPVDAPAVEPVDVPVVEPVVEPVVDPVAEPMVKDETMDNADAMMEKMAE